MVVPLGVMVSVLAHAKAVLGHARHVLINAPQHVLLHVAVIVLPIVALDVHIHALGLILVENLEISKRIGGD